jgi:bifunctional UDP-N-acetylglucosamine pyrophosphorylase/glucosamine-1-phosphate N-acetyltransferase
MDSITFLILAAGHDAGWNSSLPNAAHQLAGRLLLDHVLIAAQALAPKTILVVAEVETDCLKSAAAQGPVQFVTQEPGQSACHAIQMAQPLWKAQEGCLVILPGDIPLITSRTLQHLVESHRQSQAGLTLLSTITPAPSGHNRIIRDERGALSASVKESQATPEQRQIDEIDTGICCLQIQLLAQLLDQPGELPVHAAHGLEDWVRTLRRQNAALNIIRCEDPREVTPLASCQELAQVEKILRERKLRELMLAGVTVINPEATYIDLDVQIGRDSVVYPNVLIEGKTTIGSNCRIYPHVRISRSVLEDHVTVLDSTVIEDSLVHAGAQIGPFSRLRPKAEIGEAAHIGNFVEVKNSKIGKRTKASHHSYLGDAEIGEGVNIGAGTITCNYDGVKKNKTIIEDRVFIGSDTQLVAPVTVHAGAYVAAGSSICEDVPADSLAIARARQVNKEGWVKKRTIKP